MEIVKRLARMLKPYKKHVAVGILLQLLIISTRLIMPILTRIVVNDVLSNFNYQILMPVLVAIFMLTLMRAASGYIRGVLFEKASQDVIYDIRTNLYDHLQELPFEFYDKNRIGEIMSRMTGDVEGIRNLIAGGILTILENALYFVGSLIFMAFMSWQLTLLVLIVAPILGTLAWQFNKRIHPAFTAIREQNAVLNTRTQENLAGVRVVKAFAKEEYEKERFRTENIKQLNMNLVATRIWANYHPMLDFTSSMCTPLIIIGGSAMVYAGQMDIGTLVGVIGYIWMITNPMRMLSNMINMMAQAITSAEKLFYYMDLGSQIKEPVGAVSPSEFKGHVVFDNVTFAYGDKQVLSNISFEAQPGETIAIMGATGSGKTSIVNLLSRFYDVRSGSVKVDGIDVRNHKLKPLRREIGYVMQETFLFSDSLMDNIRFGRSDATLEEVEAAAKIAQSEDFIEAMPQGYETVVGERGLGLSGGQKQRVAIARAVLTNPSILVLDDSTSAVDMETEHAIQAELEGVMNGRTTFIIAHRISSVKNADQILVLDGGKICERGTHYELLHKKGVYFAMYNDQYRDFATITGNKVGEC